MPSSATVARALEIIGRGAVNHAYFFSKLESPDWIQPLVAKGFFRDPPPPRKHGDHVHYPTWPESSYLARMAPVAPDHVAEVIRQIPETDNTSVHTDLARAVINLPAKSMARWAGKEARWVLAQRHIQFPLGNALGAVVERLASLRRMRAALELARPLLAIRRVVNSDHPRFVSGFPQPGGSGVETSDSEHADEEDPNMSEQATAVVAGLSSRIGGLLSPYEYRRFVERHVPGLVRRGGIIVFEMLCDLLEDAIESDRLGRHDGGLGRPAIETHSQNYRDDVSDALIDAIRDASEQLVDDGVGLEAVAESLGSRKSPLFRRLILHLAAEKYSRDPELAAELVVCEEHFLDERLLHEYSRLLVLVYPILDPDRRDRVMEWISDGPPFHDFFDRDDEERRKSTIYWQRRRLAWIHPHLDERWKEEYAQIVNEIGEPENPDFRSYTTTWKGPTSPIDAEELGSRSAEEIARYVKSWQPSGDPKSPEPEGLARTLETVVADAPTEFLEAHKAFLEGPVRYVSAVLRGLFQAVRDEVAIDWPTTIDLMSWLAVRQSDDSDWRSARQDCIRLLEEGLRGDLIDIRLRKVVWNIIDTIADDTDPDPEADSKFASDLASRSFNTVRGNALHAVVTYSLWVYRSVMGTSEARPGAFGMRTIPEVRARLERHLDPAIDPSPAIRSVYGRWFPYLVLLDDAWASQHLARIFPDDQPELRDAAWETYLRYCDVYTLSFELLRGHYLAAVNRLERTRERDSTTTEGIAGFLGEHLVTLAGRGLVAWSDEDALLRRFFEKAEPDDARGAILLVGAALSRHENDMPDEAIARFERLADELLGLLEQHGGEEMGHLSSLGLWIASGRFDPAWTVDRLQRLLAFAGAAEPSFEVMDCLVEMSRSHPTEAFGALRTWLNTNRSDRSVLIGGPDEPAIAILRAALDQPSTEDDARSFIHQLGAAGHLGFGRLLDE